MSFWKKLSALFDIERDSYQLSDAGVRGLLSVRAESEILQFFESGHRVMIGQEAFVPNVLAEFRDPSVAIVYGEGRGHAFVRLNAIASVSSSLQTVSQNWRALVSALERNGYRVKHIRYLHCE